MSFKPPFAALVERLRAAVIGQEELIEHLLIAILADGHVLLEGPPGLAKTRLVRALAAAIDASFQRIQFTPDLLPADLTGGEIYRPQSGSFDFQPGPLFHEIVLADEINRAPAKVQSALLEAMEERQITIGATTRPLPAFFMVLATQNPLEHEGVYPLPEAQLDRFLFKLILTYPSNETEKAILALARTEAMDRPAPADVSVTREDLDEARRSSRKVHVAPAIEDYLVRLSQATRKPETLGPSYRGVVRYGVSPRGTIALERAAQARAWLYGRDYVTPVDVQKLLPAVFRHRVQLSWQAGESDLDIEGFLASLLRLVPAP